MISVKLETREYNRGPVDQVRVVMCDLHLGCDIVSEREVRLAQRLADELGVELIDLRRER